MGLSFHLAEVSVLGMKEKWRNQVTYQSLSVLNLVKKPADFDPLIGLIYGGFLLPCLENKWRKLP